MPTPDETLDQFGGGYEAPAGLPDPLNAALETLRRVGAIAQPPPQQPQVMPAPMVGPGPATPDQAPMPASYAPPAYEPPVASNPYQATPDLGEFPVDPVSTGLPQASTVEQADKNLNNAVEGAGLSQQAASDAEFAAKQARSEREAGATEKAAVATEKLNHETMVARDHANALADAETATWLHDLQVQATKEPNPSRWFESQSSIGQALWAIGMIAGAANVALTPGAQNVALQLFNKEIDADVERQQARLEREISALKTKGQVMEARHLRNASDLRDDHTMKLTRIQALERAWMARATVPGDLDAQATKMQGKAVFDQLKLPYIEKKHTQLTAEKNAAIDRKFQAGQQAVRLQHDAQMQREAQQFQKEQAERKFGYDLALSPVSASVGGSARNPLGKDGTPVYYELASRPTADGKPQVVLAGPDGKPTADGQVLFKDEKTWAKANETIATSDKLFNNLVKLRDDLKGEGSMYESILTGVLNPELNSVLQESGYAVAQLQNDRVTDKDFSSGVQQIVGFDPNGDWLQRSKFATNKDEIVKNLDRLISRHHKVVEAGLQQFNNAALPGQRGTRILYRPADLKPDAAPPEQTSRELQGRNNVTSAVPSAEEVAPVSGVADYEKRAKRQASDPQLRGSLLPDHDEAAVQGVLKARPLGADAIKAKVAETLAALAKRKAAATAAVDAQRVGDDWAPAADQGVLDAAVKETARVAETEAIVRAIGEDAAKKATNTLKKFEDSIKFMKNVPRFVGGASDSPERMRARAKEIGGMDAEAVEALIKKYYK